MPAKNSKNIFLFGTSKVDALPRVLKAGPITAVFDNGAIRYIRYGEHEVLRGIAYLLRDKNWATYSPTITKLKIDQGKSGFSISYYAECADAAQAMAYDVHVEASAKGTLKFTATGVPKSDFLTNRTGFVILHPLKGVIGAPVEVVHTNGKRRKTKFPKAISPGQPIFEIRSLKHSVTPGLTATVLMEGNKFEMEDHRNWMDASYKTYVCSLLDPWPYTLKKGEAFTQTVTVTLSGKPKSRPKSRSAAAISIALGKASGKLPAIGVGIPMTQADASLSNANAIAAAHPTHLVCQIDGRQSGQIAAATTFAALQRKLGKPITLEIILPAKAPAREEVDAIASHVHAAKLVPAAVIVTHAHDLKSFQPNTPRPWGPTYEEMASAARAAFPGAKVGGGMLSYFTELNRKPPPKGVFDFLTHTVCPIVHAADDVSVMETLEALPSIFATARTIIGKAPYHLGPSSIACRDNPYGDEVTPNPDQGRYCLTDNDSRQRGLFAAAWNLGLVSAAAEAKLASVTLGATTGAQGFIDQAGKPHPVFHIFAELAANSGNQRFTTANTAPSRAASLAYKTKTGSILLIANLTNDQQRVSLSGFKGKMQCHSLAPSTPRRKLASVKSVQLAPYQVLRFTW
jgi:D-apionolactonase